VPTLQAAHAMLAELRHAGFAPLVGSTLARWGWWEGSGSDGINQVRRGWIKLSIQSECADRVRPDQE
jgi:hypothetical protein